MNTNLVLTHYFCYLHGRTAFLLRGHMDYRLVLSALFVYSSQISIHILPALSHLQINIRGKMIYPCDFAMQSSHYILFIKYYMCQHHFITSGESIPCKSNLKCRNSFIHHSYEKCFLSMLSKQISQEITITSLSKTAWAGDDGT